MTRHYPMPTRRPGAGAEFSASACLGALLLCSVQACFSPASAGRAPEASPPPAASNAVPSAASAPTGSTVASQAHTAHAPPAPPSSAPGCNAPASGASQSFTKIHEEPVASLALGRAGRAAILSGTSARLFDGKRWIPLEPALAPATLQIFFGRDNEPRVLGFSDRGSGEPSQVYLRCRKHRCLPAPDELGRLGGARGALYGVLGFDDPEVVCRAGQTCLVKRASGWKSVAAHASPVPVLLSAGIAFALHEGHLERLTDRGFVALEPAHAFHDPRAVWVEPGGTIWVIDGAGDTLVRHVGEAWLEERSPVSSARAVWGSASDDVWLVGASGAAHFNGKSWSCVPSVSGPLEFVAGSDEALWLAGQSGVWRKERDRSPRIRD